MHYTREAQKGNRFFSARYVTHYLALGLQDHICTFSPRRVVLGGGTDHRHPSPIRFDVPEGRSRAQVALGG
jgi:hypothetical protein